MRMDLVWDTQILADKNASRLSPDEVSVVLPGASHEPLHSVAFQNSITHHPCRKSKNARPVSERSPTIAMDDLVQQQMEAPFQFVPFDLARRHITTIILNMNTKTLSSWIDDHLFNRILLVQSIIIMFPRMLSCPLGCRRQSQLHFTKHRKGSLPTLPITPTHNLASLFSWRCSFTTSRKALP